MTRNVLKEELRRICGSDAPLVLRLLDRYMAQLPQESAELWTCEEVAKRFSLSTGASARAQLSIWHIGAVTYRPHPVSGRPQALYDADQVRTAFDEARGYGGKAVV